MEGVSACRLIWMSPKSLPFSRSKNKKRKRQTTRIGSHQFRLFAVLPPNSSSAPLHSSAPDYTEGRPPLRRSWIGAHHANCGLGKNVVTKCSVTLIAKYFHLPDHQAGGRPFGRPESFFWLNVDDDYLIVIFQKKVNAILSEKNRMQRKERCGFTSNRTIYPDYTDHQ